MQPENALLPSKPLLFFIGFAFAASWRMLNLPEAVSVSQQSWLGIYTLTLFVLSGETPIQGDHPVSGRILSTKFQGFASSDGCNFWAAKSSCARWCQHMHESPTRHQGWKGHKDLQHHVNRHDGDAIVATLCALSLLSWSAATDGGLQPLYGVEHHVSLRMLGWEELGWS